MNQHTEIYGQEPDFRVKSTFGLAVTSLLLLTPLAINNLVDGRYAVGVGTLIVVAILGLHAWNCRRGRHLPLLTLVGLVPALILFLAFLMREQGMIGVLWCYPAVLSFYFILPESRAWLANAALLCMMLPLAWGAFEHELATRVVATLLAVSAFSAIFVRVITEQQHRLAEQAVTDPLTGLANRMLLASSLEQAVEQGHRTATPMTLLSLDLDHFKLVNDGFGHDTGDEVLRSVGTLLQRRVRLADKAFRIGGEEFLVLLFATDPEHAQMAAEEMRAEIEALPMVADHPITVSIGVASLAADDDWKSWMKRGDQNLYRAKEGGRNQVVA